jgi:hypothetical protein
MKRSLIVALAFAACAAPASAGFRVQLQGPADHTLRGRHGLHAVDSRGSASLVRVISPGSLVNRIGTVRVLVMNLGDKPFTFGPGDVAIALADGTSLPIVAQREFEAGAQIVETESARRDSVNARNMANLSSLSQSAATGVTVLNPNASAGPPGAGPGSEAGKLDHPGAADRSAAQEIRTAVDGLMVSRVVRPQGGAGGYLVFALPKPVRTAKTDLNLVVTVRTGGETHRFEAILDRR